ncbi:hypothetical protein GF345_03845, partial [Candidatus Woesearchaeota archaeon]|nr:hypothetical protein [Candidatus Woesearchaeota archaeon]
MNMIITITAVILAAMAATYLAKKIKMPSVVALILIGLVMDIPLIKQYTVGTNGNTLYLIGDLGLIALMFLAGIESSWRLLFNEKKDAGVIAALGAVVPFILGFLVMIMLDFSVSIAVIVGICMSITAEATKAKVLLELNKLKTKVGAAMMGAGIIDDLIGLFLFIAATHFIKGINIKEDVLIIIAITAFFIGVA